MKYVKLFEQFENIHQICNKYDIKNYTINTDGSIDVNGNVDLSYKKLDRLPLKFNKVSGDFFCCNNNQLTTLEGSPKEVDGNFICFSNELSTLEGSPRIVRKSFDCGGNDIFTFEGAPDYINGDFYCIYNPIEIIWDLFKDWKYVELLNDYDLLRIKDGEYVLIWDRLIDFLETIKKPKVKKYEIMEIYKIIV